MLGLGGGQHSLPYFWPHWYFNSKGAFGSRLEGDHLAQIAIQKSLLVSTCELRCGWESCKGVRGTCTLIGANDNIWAVGLTLPPPLLSAQGSRSLLQFWTHRPWHRRTRGHIANRPGQHIASPSLSACVSALESGLRNSKSDASRLANSPPMLLKS